MFKVQGDELVSLCNKDVAPQEVKTDLLTARQRGEESLENFLATRLTPQTDTGTDIAFYAPMQKIKSKTFANIYKVKVGSGRQQQQHVQADRALCRRLLAVTQSGRKVDLHSLMKHEMSPVPLALARTDGTLLPADKAPLLHILEENSTADVLPPAQAGMRTATIIDGMALVQELGKPKDAHTFGDLADVYKGCVLSNFSTTCSRVDVVFDTYLEDSVKAGTRKRRTGETKGIRRSIQGRDVPLPTQWKSFICVLSNKKDLARFLKEQLSESSTKLPEGYELVVAYGSDEGNVCTNTQRDVSHLESTQEEADTRLLLHAADVQESGFHRTVISSPDTDVLVLLVHFCHVLTPEVWMRTKRNNIAVHNINLPTQVSRSLPAFHAFSGCDTTSQFAGHGKKGAWKLFSERPHLLEQITDASLTDEALALAEQFVVLLYGSTCCRLTSVDELRVRQLYSKPSEKLPPTRVGINT